MKLLVTFLGIREFYQRIIIVVLVVFFIGITSTCQLVITPPTYLENHNRFQSYETSTLGTGQDILADWITINSIYPDLGTEHPNIPKPDAEKKDLKDEIETCPSNVDGFSQIIVLPELPHSQKPLTVLAWTRDQTAKLSLKVLDPAGNPIAPQRSEAWGYIPKALSATFKTLKKGKYKALLLKDDSPKVLSCLEISVPGAKDELELTQSTQTGAWPIRRKWSPKMEDLFSVFVAKLFHVPKGSRKGWGALHRPTRDPYRNILYGILGRDEDTPTSQTHVILEPDCADAPYLVRAYFAWKMGLAFVFNKCTRGDSEKGPKCFDAYSNLVTDYDHIPDPVARFNAFVETTILLEVHSGNGLTLPDSHPSDFYPIPLDHSAIRPGVIFVDSGGHFIMVTQVEPQTEITMGAIFGIDAHPDLTVTHKRFSSGTFVFRHWKPTDGFKAFRPLWESDGKRTFLSNSEINENGGYPPYSDEQANLEKTTHFYTNIYKLLNPRPVDPKTVLITKIEILLTAILERVAAVQAGVDYMTDTNWNVVPMPDGPSIFQTIGPWETYSTPARDLRCFLALDAVLKFPDAVIRNRSLYNTDPLKTDAALRRDLTTLMNKRLSEKEIQYNRSDGSTWTLSLKEVVKRQRHLEMAYNPNDCPETRWAAPRGSNENKTCLKKAPEDQQQKMRLARFWFASRRRPDQQ